MEIKGRERERERGHSDLVEAKVNHLLVVFGLQLVALAQVLLLPLSRRQFAGRCRTTSDH